MVTATRHECPAEAIEQGTAAPAAEPAGDGSTIITDSKGRKLKLREPDILTESRQVRMLGEAAQNIAYMMSYVSPASLVVEIDGEPQPYPMTEREVEASIQRLGRHGLSAVLHHFVQEAEKAKQATSKGDALKK